jgi:hypothetical protein
MTRTSRRSPISALLGTLSFFAVVACSSDGHRAAESRATILDPSGAAGSAAGSSGLGLPPPGTGGYAPAVTGGASSVAGSTSAAAVTAGSSGVAATTAGTSAAGGGTTAAGCGTSAAAGGTSAASGGSATTGTGGLRVRTGEACDGYPVEANAAADPEVCVGVTYGVEPIPVDMYIMADRSSSMNEALEGSELTRWQVLANAMQAFVNDPQAIASRARVGLGFFGYAATTDEQVECKPENYATPLVPIGELEQTGPLITAKIEQMSQSVGGSAPTHAALQGALQYAAAGGRTAAARRRVARPGIVRAASQRQRGCHQQRSAPDDWLCTL